MRKWASAAAHRPGVDFNPGDDAEMEVLNTLNRQRISVELLIFIFMLLSLVKFAVFFGKRE